MLAALKTSIKNDPRFRRSLYDPYQAARFFLDGSFRREWNARIDDVLACPDLHSIPRVPGAGTTDRDTQLLHNGLRVVKNSYYSYPITRLLRLSGGVHEPQEEKAFAAVLPSIPAGGVMIELGAYWSFYSMWFNQAVRCARNILVEPDPANLRFGQMNFALNDMRGTFIQAVIGHASSPGALCVDDIVARQGVEFLHMLHSDIQGHEYEMLLGSAKTFDAGKIGYVFISTHGDVLHEQCIDFLHARGFNILCEASPSESYSVDGIIAAKSPAIPGPDRISISKK